ncbi:MAG: DUF2127 domain-containing protein [Rudaea sp.]
MSATRAWLDEKTIHLVFVVSLWLKAAFALVEIVGGFIAYFVTHEFLIGIARVITQGELAEDPHDRVANYLHHAVENFSIDSQHFTAVYLLGHGLVKLWLVIGLLRERLWYYPAALVIFSAFIGYQAYRFYFTCSFLLLFVTFVDLIVIALTWHEYRYLKGIAR